MTHTAKIIFVTLLLLIAGVAYVEYPKQTTPTPEPVVCTADAKICPDGTGVGRTGPQCEFASCPVITATTSAHIGEKINAQGVYVTPLQVTEDSRCPIGVYCIQAGTVSLKAKLQLESNSEETVLKMGVPVVFAGNSVTLVSVLPIKRTGTEIQNNEYVFTFAVKAATSVTTKGTLQGSVAIGPVCPVEMQGPACVPNAEMYAAAKVFVYAPDKKTLIETITPNASGKFSIQLPAGQYFIDMIHQTVGGTTGVPTTITITPGKTVNLSLKVDTGLR